LTDPVNAYDVLPPLMAKNPFEIHSTCQTNRQSPRTRFKARTTDL